MSGVSEASSDEPFFAVSPGKLRKVRRRELALRFAFGAAVSMVAGVVSLINPVLGGLFLAFPAILPASMTLIEEKESSEKAAHDVEGATMGALGLAVFAVVAGASLGRTTAVIALGMATVAWLVSSCFIYLIVEAVLRSRRRSSSDPNAGISSRGPA